MSFKKRYKPNNRLSFRRTFVLLKQKISWQAQNIKIAKRRTEIKTI